MVDFKDFLISLLSFLLPNDRLNCASHVLVTHLCHLFTKIALWSELRESSETEFDIITQVGG